MSAEINDGGPAFPVGFQEFDQTVHGKVPYIGFPGMSLRAWLAGKALQGLITNGKIPADKMQVAISARDYADCMIYALNKK